jgi:hypothetical protein
MLRDVAMIALLVVPLPALAQDNVVATATLPRDLSPWGMYLNADAVVKAVLIGLAFASVVTWTVWLAKTIEIFFAKRRVRGALNRLVGVRSTAGAVERLADAVGEVAQFLDAAVSELKVSTFLDLAAVCEEAAETSSIVCRAANPGQVRSATWPGPSAGARSASI